MLNFVNTYAIFNNYQILRMSKALYDYKRDLMDCLSGIELHSDNIYEVFMSILGNICSNIRIYNSEDYEDELLYLRDARLDEYFSLMLEYGKLTNKQTEDNPYFSELISSIDNSFSFNHRMSAYDFRYNKRTNKALRILINLYSDFSCFYEVIEGVISLMKFVEENTEKLKLLIANIKMEAAA